MKKLSLPNRRLLVVDDDVAGRKTLAIALKKQGWTVLQAAHGKQALEVLAAEPVDMIVSDLNMPVMDGLTFLETLRSSGATTPVLMVTAFAEIANVVKAMQAGADDVLAKPYDLATLLFRIDKALELVRLVRDNLCLTAQGKAPFVVGTSKAMQSVMRQAAAVAPTPAPVLIYGESGTGKELLARHLHERSSLALKPFITVFCGAIPETLFESELFGYEKGAFTGADRAKRGLVEAADGGTLFFDEIGELPLSMQVKLLRLLQEGEIRRLGSTTTTKVNIRIIAATNRNLEQEVKEGNFREDLYFRLKVVPITLPPLRDRLEDLPLLLEHFRVLVNKEYGRSVAAFTPSVVEVLAAEGWPGNIRELENKVRQLIIMATGDVVLLGSSESEIQTGEKPALNLGSRFDFDLISEGKDFPIYCDARDAIMDAFDCAYLENSLRLTGGNVTEAAKLSKKDRREFHRLMQKRGVDASTYRKDCVEAEDEE